MSLKIDTIKVRNFRGIRCINLLLRGENLVIAGENGAGKSSIVDALEFFFTGRVAPLEGRSDVDKNQCIPNLKGGPTEVKLAFKGVAPESGISIGFPRRRANIPNALRRFFAIAAKQTFVLRRYQVLQFVNSRDSDRYKQISQLVGLKSVDATDAAWRKEWIAAQKQATALRDDQRKIWERLAALLGRPVKTHHELIQAINAVLIPRHVSPAADRQDLKQRLETLRRREQSSSDVTRAEKLRILQERTAAAAPAVDTLLADNSHLYQNLQALWRQRTTLEDAELEALLSEGYRIVQGHLDLRICPLCEAPIADYDALLQRLGERLEHLQGLTRRRRRVDEGKTALESSLAALMDMLAAISESLSALQITDHATLIQEALSEMGNWREALTQPDWEVQLVWKWQENLPLPRLQQALSQLEIEIAEQLQQLAPTQAEADLIDLLMTLTRVDEQWRQLEENESNLRKAEYVNQQIDVVYNELLAARKRGLERLSQELEGDFERFYQQLHPGEGYEAISIPVQQERRSSIALRATYQEQDQAHPINYFSEGHLDSLGLCIFLAFIKRFNQDLKLIVLDDVLTTVDAGHRLRVARLLKQEFPDHQFVITTHDQLWAKELERVLPNTKLVPLIRWSWDQGADCMQEAPSDWEYYERQARDGRPQDAIAGAGRNLEKFLFQMRGNLGLAIPAKPNDNYTIGDLYPPFFSWVKKHPVQRLDNPYYAQELEALKNELDQVWRLRNWTGAHFNTWAETVSSNEALSFLNAIQRLVTAFECPVCHSLVCYNSAARALICPTCDPSPPPRVAWQYRPGWRAKAIKLMQTQKQSVRSNAVPMTQNTFERFLRDLRHRLGFPVTAEPYDRYEVEQLYQPFFEWAERHPRSGIHDWQRAIQQSREALDAFWQGGAWKAVPDAEIDAFIDVVQELISLFECGTCSQLLDYDHQQTTYFCAGCTDQPTIPDSLSAYWFVDR